MDESSAQPPVSVQVLCIEDEHFISELYMRALTTAGYTVNVVVDGRDGLAEAQTNKYDIILLDIMVPTMTGIEILHSLRNSEGTAPQLKAKIIITTNVQQNEVERASIESLADGYVIKADITPRELVTLLDQIILPGRNHTTPTQV